MQPQSRPSNWIPKEEWDKLTPEQRIQWKKGSGKPQNSPNKRVGMVRQETPELLIDSSSPENKRKPSYVYQQQEPAALLKELLTSEFFFFNEGNLYVEYEGTNFKVDTGADIIVVKPSEAGNPLEKKSDHTKL